MVRTGYESVIGMRTGAMFAKVAKEDGVVTSITDKGITVKYKSGKEEGYPLGTLFGKAEGSVYPHTLVTQMKVGQKFKKDEYLTYNSNFFTPDPILPGGIVYKGSLMARVALVELPETHEDSSTISMDLARRLKTTVTKVKTFTVDFKQNVLNVVKVGQAVKPEDILMTIEDEITASDSSFGEESLAILSERAKNSPRASYVGSIADLEVFYHGELNEMSNSLKSLAMMSDRKKAAEAKARMKSYATGRVDGEFTVDGTPLAVGKAVIRIYINVGDTASLGDKVVFGNQLKSVIGEVMPYTIRTESGDIVDAKMGAKSFAARIVRSLVMIGERATTLNVLAKAACKAYRGS